MKIVSALLLLFVFGCSDGSSNKYEADASVSTEMAAPPTAAEVNYDNDSASMVQEQKIH